MQYACVLRLGHLSRQLPARHFCPRQLLLPHVTLRTSHGSSVGEMGSLEEVHAQGDQHKTEAGMKDAQTQEKRSPFWMNRARRTGSHQSKDTPTPLMKIRSTFKPQDMRVQFVKEFDKLEDESRELAKVLNRFAQTEKHQRSRLAKQVAEQDWKNASARFVAWKNALKDFNPDSLQPLPKSIMEMKQVNWIQRCSTSDEMMAEWPSTAPERMKKTHRDGSLALLSAAVRYVPDKVHMVFEAAIASPYGLPYWYVVEDVLELLARRLRVVSDEKDKSLAAQKLAQMAARILQLRGKGIVQFSQFTIQSILDELPADLVESWYSQLLDAGCDLHPYTEVNFASRLAKSSPTKALSAQVLMRLQQAKLLDINSPIAASIVTTILSFTKEQLAKLDGNTATPADLFRDLHDAGLIPNVITYTAIIRGLCLKEDLETALDVFEVMQQHGVLPNEWTYSILLHGCKMRCDWTAFANIALQACNANVRANVVWNEVLHGIYICCLKQVEEGRPKRASLYAMNSFYSRIFDATPIRPFITGRLAEMGQHVGQQQYFPEPLRRLAAEFPTLPPNELNSPGPDTVGILLLSIIRALPMPYDVVVFYSQYRQMLKQGHPVARRMVQEKGSLVHDIVLRNLIKWPGTLRVALDILQDMMRDSKELASTGTQSSSSNREEAVQDSEQNTNADPEPSSDPLLSPIPHPTPSVYTWTVLIHGFMRARQPQDAEYIMTLMRKNGIEPNRVTWNTLAAGYARMQKVPEAVDAMRRLESEGHEADDWTMRAFSYIGNKAKAIEMMEATVEANKAHQLAVDLQSEQQEQSLSTDQWATGAVGQMPQEVAETKEIVEKEAQEQEEEDFLDRELDAGMGMNFDTPLGVDATAEANVELDDAALLNLEKRIAQKAGSYSALKENLAEIGSVEGSREDTEGWRAVQKDGLDALSHMAHRPVSTPQEDPLAELTKKRSSADKRIGIEKRLLTKKQPSKKYDPSMKKRQRSDHRPSTKKDQE